MALYAKGALTLGSGLCFINELFLVKQVYEVRKLKSDARVIFYLCEFALNKKEKRPLKNACRFISNKLRLFIVKLKHFYFESFIFHKFLKLKFPLDFKKMSELRKISNQQKFSNKEIRNLAIILSKLFGFNFEKRKVKDERPVKKVEKQLKSLGKKRIVSKNSQSKLNIKTEKIGKSKFVSLSKKEELRKKFMYYYTKYAILSLQSIEENDISYFDELEMDMGPGNSGEIKIIKEKLIDVYKKYKKYLKSVKK